MKRLFSIAFALAALSGPLYAQQMRGERPKTPLQVEEEQRKKEAEKVDQEYTAAMKKGQIGATQKVVVDPWQNMRTVDDSKPKH